MNPEQTLKKYEQFLNRVDVAKTLEIMIENLSQIYESDQKLANKDPMELLQIKLGLKSAKPEKLPSSTKSKRKSNFQEFEVEVDEETLRQEQEDLQSDIQRLTE